MDTTDKSTLPPKKCLERLELSNKPTLLITRELQEKIDYLHNRVGRFEWSGELITREEGSINDLNDWKIIAEDLFLVDIGSAGFTGYEVDKGSFKAGDIVDLYEAYPGLMDGGLKLQHLHSHHGMGSFFSATDWENLEDRAVVSNYFLMLIVNFDGKWCAKVAFKAERENIPSVKLNFVNNIDGCKPLVLEGNGGGEVLVVMDCIIQKESGAVPQEFINRYDVVKKIKEEEAEQLRKKHSYTPQKYNGNGQGTMFPEYKGYPSGTNWSEPKNDGEMDTERRPPKRISEMTEKEWKRSQSGVEEFGFRHGRAFINSILDGTYSPDDFSDPILKIEQLDLKLGSKGKKTDFISEFGFGLQEHFDVIFPYNDDNDYCDLLKVVRDLLFPYVNRCSLLAQMVEEVTCAIEYYNEPLIPVQHDR